MKLLQLHEQEKEQNKEINSTRQHPRHPISLKVIFETGATLTMQKYHEREADGDTRDLSEGGLCLITDQALKESQIIRLRLPIPNVCATMPTLAEVRWVKKQAVKPVANVRPAGDRPAGLRGTISRQNGSHRYVAGLRFLF